ncbi:uncharacterized protein LOC130690137 [Daphnia carinata]|uniref:uncharacterized protein LOC130690137 n=1 Tax=Daphnia carinata TaxID=120202 RepID=UPI00257CA3DA|nr:uncharacterized protein LOC130690137 [Daphnia carinata]
MRNASIWRTPACDNRWRRRTSPAFVVLAFFGLCLAVTQAEDGYSIPADAIRIRTEELGADRLTQHLAVLMASGGTNVSANSLDVGDPMDERDNHVNGEAQQGELEELEERVGQADDRHLPTALVRLNALLRAAEERKERLESNAATSRLLSINRGGFFRGLLVVWVPVSFLLPTLAHRRPAYYRARSSRGRKHFTDDNNIIVDKPNVKPAKMAHFDYDADSPDYKFESHYGPLLSRLEAYFTLMRIDNIHCRWKLLCYASRQPDAYQPLSSLFRRLFERSSKPAAAKPINQQSYHPALKKFFTYVWADKKGSRFTSSEQCDAEYRMCPTPVNRLIRMDMIRFWQKLSKRFAIQLQDE